MPSSGGQLGRFNLQTFAMDPSTPTDLTSVHSVPRTQRRRYFFFLEDFAVSEKLGDVIYIVGDFLFGQL